MQEVFEDNEHQAVEQRHDTELTLSPMILLCLFFGLLLLCGLCFGLGYSMGSRSAREASTVGQQSGVIAASPAAGSLVKPSPVAASAPVLHPDLVELPPTGPLVANPSADTGASGDAGSTKPIVKPALPAAANTPVSESAAAQPAPALPVPAGKAASVPVITLMVQIATVSHQEDADVLVGALRKRGYAVTVRRDPVDNQIHVQIGPFTSRSEANAKRQKLLNDGYNAIVQP